MAIAAEFGQLEAGVVFAPALGELTVEQQREREIPACVCEVGLERKRVPERVDGRADFVLRLQCETEIVPGDCVLGLSASVRRYAATASTSRSAAASARPRLL